MLGLEGALRLYLRTRKLPSSLAPGELMAGILWSPENYCSRERSYHVGVLAEVSSLFIPSAFLVYFCTVWVNLVESPVILTNLLRRSRKNICKASYLELATRTFLCWNFLLMDGQFCLWLWILCPFHKKEMPQEMRNVNNRPRLPEQAELNKQKKWKGPH